VRRQFNHVFFKRLLVDDEGVAGSELTDEFALVLSEDMVNRFQRSEPASSGAGSIVDRLVEVAGIEPASSGDHLGLLRA
jgi:hypothetical protein